MNSLGIVIKKYREVRQITQLELAKKANIGSGTLGDIERGVNKSTIKTLNKIAKALELSELEKNDLDNAFLGKDAKSRNMIEHLNDPIKMMSVPVFSSVAAGLGFIPDCEPIDYINVPETSGECIGAKVSGDSMEQTFYDADIVILKKEVEVGIGEIGVFQNRNTGEALVKRLKKKNGVYILESDNHLFRDIEIKTDEIVCCGKVISVVKKDLKKRINPLIEKIEMLDPKQQEILEMMINGLLEKNNKE
ncbi:MAG: LexA family protein [Cetobacterium sp.]